MMKKMGNPFVNKMNQIRRFKDTLLEDETQTEGIREWFVKNTSDLIKRELDRYLKDETFEDNVWNLACDKLKNYKEYFADNNVCNLNLTSLG
jgi:ribonucleotide reductase beta subunit family protein with ferritin-like domain